MTGVYSLVLLNETLKKYQIHKRFSRFSQKPQIHQNIFVVALFFSKDSLWNDVIRIRLKGEFSLVSAVNIFTLKDPPTAQKNLSLIHI